MTKHPPKSKQRSLAKAVITTGNFNAEMTSAVCNSVTVLKKGLIHHEACHDREYYTSMDFTEECDICPARFSCNRRRGTHENQHAKVANTETDYIHKCETCSHSYNSEDALQRHSANECPQETSICRTCKEIIPTEYGIRVLGWLVCKKW